MHPIEKLLCRAQERELTPTLKELGGARAVASASAELASSSSAPEILRIALAALPGGDEDTKKDIGAFAIACASLECDEFAAEEVVEIIVRATLPDKILAACFDRFLVRAREWDAEPITRAWALNGAWQLAVGAPSRKFALLAFLCSLALSDEPEFLRCASKIVGLAHSHWQASELVDALIPMADHPVIRDEVTYELGMVELGNALNAPDCPSAVRHFGAAQEWFRASLDGREHRPDADAYATAIEVLLRFERNEPPGDIVPSADRLRRAVTIHRAWNAGDGQPSWIGTRTEAMIQWQSLAITVLALAENLDEPGWYDPASVIEGSVLRAYVASRSVLRLGREGGVEQILRPRIENSFVTNKAQLHVLDRWLEREVAKGDWSNAAKELRARLHGRTSVGGSIDALKLVGRHDLLTATLGPEDTERIPAHRRDAAEQILEDHIALYRRYSSPALTKLLESCTRALYGVSDYRDPDTQCEFNVILLHTLMFLRSRMDETCRNNPRLSYLFESKSGARPPKEDKLQADYHEYMDGNLVVATAPVEVFDIGGGRADMVVRFGQRRYVIEVKRELRDASFENLRASYLGQTTEYQNTNVRLGVLLVLDLTPKAAGSMHIAEQVKVEVVRRKGESEDRGIVVVRVPGRRRTPRGVLGPSSGAT